MCKRVHERLKIADARTVDEAGGGREEGAAMECSCCWSRDINIKVTRLATEGAYCPAQCDGMVQGVVSCPWGWVEVGLAPEVGARSGSIEQDSTVKYWKDQIHSHFLSTLHSQQLQKSIGQTSIFLVILLALTSKLARTNIAGT